MELEVISRIVILGLAIGCICALIGIGLNLLWGAPGTSPQITSQLGSSRDNDPMLLGSQMTMVLSRWET